MNKKKNYIIFGGGGYIGSYLVNHIISYDLAEKVYIFDIMEPRKEIWNQKVFSAHRSGRVEYRKCDVRSPITFEVGVVHLIINLAAIHREPGHDAFEYFETNILGAENVVDYADRVGCKKIVFTSSIAPYGHAETARDELSQVVPYSSYGSSKLAAEKIHEGWLKQGDGRKLIIVRPGVIFGPYEDGNVPRLKNALKKNAFCYVGNKQAQKAGGYVKELVLTIFWVLELMDREARDYVLYNFSFPDPPSIEEYVNTVLDVLGVKRIVPNFPFLIVYTASLVLNVILSGLGINNPAHPARIKKLCVNNLILPTFLLEHGYKYRYDLKAAMADWKEHAPEEW
jgi:GlcNAc-P-P-Und epimerase